MSELFGAPSGIIAWDQNARANAESAIKIQNSQLDAQAKLNELALTPEKAALMRAQARNQNALAADHEVATSIKQQQLGFEDAYKAYQKLGQAAAERGQLATWQDLPDAAQERNPDGSARPMAQTILAPEYSITKPLEDKLRFLQKAGAPTVMMEPLIKEISKVKQEAAVTEYRSAQASEQKQKQQMEQLQAAAGMALAASKDPEAYEQLRMTLSSNQDPRVRALLSRLTGDFAADSPKLAAFAQQALTAQQQIEAKRKADQLKLEQDQFDVNKGKARVAAGVAAAQVTVLNARAAALSKEEGAGTVNQVAVNDQKLYAAYQRDLKAREAQYPPAPLNPAYYTAQNANQAYTLKDGSVGRLITENGQRRWDIIKPPLKEVKPPRSIEDIAKGRKAAKAAAMEDDLDDDLEP